MLSEQEQSAIIRSLEKILSDEKFSGSPQMSAFLRYVVTETLLGNADRIKAYTVAVDALGKSEAFDPQNDPSVRVLAKRLRGCLDNYYERTSNHEIIIEMRAGSYRPIFSEPHSLLPGDASESHSDVVRVEREVPNTHYKRDSGLATHNASLNQASFKPLITRSGNTECATEARSDASQGVFDHTLDASRNASLNSNQDVSLNSNDDASTEPVERVIDKPVDSTAANDQTVAQTPKPDNTSNLSKLHDTVQANKLLSSVMLLLTLVTVTWGFNSSIDQSKNIDAVAAENIQDIYALQLASASNSRNLRQRPAIPTVIVRTESREDKTSQSLVSSISHVLSKFDHLQVLKSTQEYEMAEKWPEDYEIVVDTLVMNDSKKITVNLINAASGRITYSDELFLKSKASNGAVISSFSKNNIAAVELFVAKIVQKNGPLLANYKSQEQYSETMACVFLVTANNKAQRSNEDCLNKMISPGQSETIQHALRAELSLVNLANVSGSKRKAALKNALAAAQKSVDIAPHSADAHTLMMRVLHLSGDYKTALKHGNYAMDINDLDGNNMLALAGLLDEMKKPSEADEMRKQASVLSTTMSGISL